MRNCAADRRYFSYRSPVISSVPADVVAMTGGAHRRIVGRRTDGAIDLLSSKIIVGFGLVRLDHGEEVRSISVRVRRNLLFFIRSPSSFTIKSWETSLVTVCIVSQHA